MSIRSEEGEPKSTTTVEVQAERQHWWALIAVVIFYVGLDTIVNYRSAQGAAPTLNILGASIGFNAVVLPAGALYGWIPVALVYRLSGNKLRANRVSSWAMAILVGRIIISVAGGSVG